MLAGRPAQRLRSGRAVLSVIEITILSVIKIARLGYTKSLEVSGKDVITISWLVIDSAVFNREVDRGRFVQTDVFFMVGLQVNCELKNLCKTLRAKHNDKFHIDAILRSCSHPTLLLNEIGPFVSQRRPLRRRHTGVPCAQLEQDALEQLFFRHLVFNSAVL
jgi:hypothetical protein